MSKNQADSKNIDLLFDGYIPVPERLISFEEILKYMDQIKKVDTVFRIENSEGKGPYSRDEWRSTPHTPANKRPTPNCDDGFSIWFQKSNEERLRKDWFHYLQRSKGDRNILFGFSSITQLFKWFHNEKEFNALLKMGFRIKIYRKVQGYDSGSQVIFWK